MDDELGLLRRARQGDRQALDDLLRHHYGRIHAVCRRVTGTDADGDDATQEALLAIVRNLHRFEGTSRFGTWAYRIAVNAALDELRRRRRRGGPVDPALMREPPPSASQEAGVDDRLTIDAALARLSEEFRVAVVLRDLAGLDYAAIAEVLDIPIGTVRSRIARGRAALVPLLHGNSPIIQQRPSTSP